MTVLLVIPGLEEILKQGDPGALPRPHAGSPSFFFSCRGLRPAPDHVDLFDGILIDLVPHTETAARADWPNGLSGSHAARRAWSATRARDEILIAGRCCAGRRCSMRPPGRNRAPPGTGHLLAMSERATLSAIVTEQFRGDRDVVRRAPAMRRAISPTDIPH